MSALSLFSVSSAPSLSSPSSSSPSWSLSSLSSPLPCPRPPLPHPRRSRSCRSNPFRCWSHPFRCRSRPRCCPRCPCLRRARLSRSRPIPLFLLVPANTDGERKRVREPRLSVHCCDKKGTHYSYAPAAAAVVPRLPPPLWLLILSDTDFTEKERER